MIGIDTLALVISGAIFAITVMAGLALRLAEPSAHRIIVIALGWTVLVTLPYWIFGSSSYLYAGDEAAIPVANYLHWLAHFNGGKFMHDALGGLDARSSIVGLGSFFSIERLLLATFPLWIAILVQKIAVLLVGATGAYLLARDAGGASRGLALTLALAASVAHHFLTVATFHNGLGYALTPWFALIIACRADSRPAGAYWSEVALLLALNTVSSLPTHTFFANAGAAFFSGLLLERRRWWRIAGALFAAVPAYLINWHDGLSGLFALTPHTTRVMLSSRPESWVEALALAWPSAGYGRIAIIGLFVSIVVLWLTHNQRAARATVVGVLATWGGPTLIMFPFSAVSLHPLGAINYAYINFCIPTLAVVVVSWAASSLLAQPRGFRAAPFILAAACAAVTWQQTQDFFYLLTDGGQRNFTIANLAKPSWARAAEARVVTVPFRLRPNYMLIYGLDTMDGQFTVVPRAFQAFTRSVRQGQGGVSLSGAVSVTRAFDPLCCDRYAVTDLMDIKPLRLGNVGFIVTTVPLTGDNLSRVSGPKIELNPYRRDQPLENRLIAFWTRIFKPDDAWVYAIENPLPRFFFARDLTILPDEVSDEAVLAHAVDLIDQHPAVIRAADAGTLHSELKGSNMARAHVIGYEKIPDGYRIQVNAPGGGVLVVNTPFLPFWKARLAGELLSVVSANVIHMAIAVPPGSTMLTLSYARPTFMSLVGS